MNAQNNFALSVFAHFWCEFFCTLQRYTDVSLTFVAIVGENDIGAPKIGNNSNIAIEMLIFSLLLLGKLSHLIFFASFFGISYLTVFFIALPTITIFVAISRPKGNSENFYFFLSEKEERLNRQLYKKEYMEKCTKLIQKIKRPVQE